MPNGVSCAYFAARNMVYGTKEDNMFKEGIAAVQAVRTVDAVANSSFKFTNKLSGGVKTGCSKFANSAKILLYPLIVASGIYNTVKSKDKVKTGVSQGVAIGSMFASEQGLKYVQKKALPKLFCFLSKKMPAKMVNSFKKISKGLSSNRCGRILLYILQGILFASVSMSGYNMGSKISENIIDKVRKSKTTHKKEEMQTQNANKGEEIFDDIKL